MRLPKDLVETAMNIVINEAQEGDLHNHLRTKISAEYGIDPDHKNWSQIKPEASINNYATQVYGKFTEKIEAVHEKREKPLESSEINRRRKDRLSGGDQGYLSDFGDFVSGVHRDYHNR